MDDILSNESGYSVYISIKTLDLDVDPDIITSLTGVIPTRISRKTHRPPGSRNKIDLWVVNSVAVKQSVDLREHYNYIINHIGSNFDKFVVIFSERYFVQIDIVVKIYNKYNDILVPKELMSFADKIRSDIKIYIYDLREDPGSVN